MNINSIAYKIKIIVLKWLIVLSKLTEYAVFEMFTKKINVFMA